MKGRTEPKHTKTCSRDCWELHVTLNDGGHGILHIPRGKNQDRMREYYEKGIKDLKVNITP